MCVCFVGQARVVLVATLHQVEALESRVSLVDSSRLSGDFSTEQGCRLDVAVESVLHLLERLLVFMQCLAADAATISNASNAVKVEVLVGAIMQACEAAGRGHSQQPQMCGQSGAATGLVWVRNAAGTASKQRCQELEGQVFALQLQVADTSSQLAAAVSANARLQRVANLQTRAAANLERQLLAVQSELQQLQCSKADREGILLQLQQELASSRLLQARAAAESTAQAGELQAAEGRARAAEGARQEAHAAADAASEATVRLTEQLQLAMEASQHDVLVAATAQGAQAAAALRVDQLQQQLATTAGRVVELEHEVKECRHKADICVQAARDAEYRAVETTTLLADARRENEFSQHLLLVLQQGQQGQEQHNDTVG